MEEIESAMTSQEIRQQFIDFFVQKHGHTFVPSSAVVPYDDPTLMFTNAGMNQFKPIFLGQEKREYNRAVNTQKCIRAGGKHNDLDDVGRSRRHHTFFEMLGNWSFGNYFKQGAIEMAWELLTKVWKLDPDRLHVSCYEGNEAAGIPRDTEAADIWRKVAGVAEDHIHFFGKDNFWEMGETGPCGPCTEIYVDRRPMEEIAADKKAGRKAPVNGEDPRVMEIWNNVFIQYNRDESGKLTELPAQHVDTGMGLERICQVLQGKDDNFGTDLWSPLFDKISEISNLKYTGLFPKTNAADPVAEAANPQLRHDIAFRVIADHARCLTFALTDGAVPSNEGRGYVLRRILRRAVRFGRQQLNLHEPFLHTLVPVIVESMGNVFPELKKNPGRVVELIKDEELSFGKTLDRGIQLFEEAAKVGHIKAEDAFKLHDTYGFPIDLTRIMAEERGMTVDIAGYEKLMEEAREKARAGGKDRESELKDLSPDSLSQLAKAGIKPTDDAAKYDSGKNSPHPNPPPEYRERGPDGISPSPGTPGEGGVGTAFTAKVVAVWDGSNLFTSPTDKIIGEQIAVLLDRTNFYAEMGGQVGDTGTLTVREFPIDHPSAARLVRQHAGTFAVNSTRIVGGYIMHVGKITAGELQIGQTVAATVATSRNLTQQNHTTTHIANWALREVLGDDVQQKGSLVDPEKLRFDFSHGKAMTDDELAKVEQLVNQEISKKHTVYAETAPQEQALKIHGLRAVFGEKYPPMVRVVSIGASVKDLLADPSNPKWRQYSIEFCGGTHLDNAAEAQSFAIMAEESVSKGIRRLVGITGEATKKAIEHVAVMDAAIAIAQKSPDEKLADALSNLQKLIAAGNLPLRAKRRGQAAVQDIQSRIKAFEKAKKAAASSSIDAAAIAHSLLEKAPVIGGGKIVVGDISGASDDQLRGAIESLKKKSPSIGVLLGAVTDGKISFIAVVSDDLIAKGLKAGDWIREVAKICGGGGGGRPNMAQAGGKDAAKLPDALERAKSFATDTIK